MSEDNPPSEKTEEAAEVKAEEAKAAEAPSVEAKADDANPETAQWVQRLRPSTPAKLSRAKIEPLAIVSSRHPVPRPEIDEIRGVDSGGTLKTLLDRSLIRILGKKEEPGRPMLYGTTKEFLEFFNLPDLKDLPTLREFHELSEQHQAQVAALLSAAPDCWIA